MMCWKDRTFCNFDDCDEWNTCNRAFTNEKQVAAGEWWKRGGGKAEDAPVCFYADKPQCYKEQK